MEPGRPIRPDTAGLVVLILATAVAVSLVVAFVAAAVRNQPFSAEGIDLTSTVAGAIIGVVAVYVGQRSARRPGQ